MTRSEYFYQTSLTDSVRGLDTAVFRPLRHCIDLEIHPKKHAFMYEDACLSSLDARMRDTDIGIGPHLLDRVLGRSWLNGVVRPDALIFSVEHASWRLRYMAEFKSGKHNGIHGKLDGFSVLLKKFRTHEQYFKTMLFQYLGDVMIPPRSIVIPSDIDIDVILMQPFETGAGDYGRTEFPISYIRIPSDAAGTGKKPVD